jgi:hypothetical protein
MQNFLLFSRTNYRKASLKLNAIDCQENSASTSGEGAGRNLELSYIQELSFRDPNSNFKTFVQISNFKKSKYQQNYTTA